MGGELTLGANLDHVAADLYAGLGFVTANPPAISAMARAHPLVCGAEYDRSVPHGDGWIERKPTGWMLRVCPSQSPGMLELSLAVALARVVVLELVLPPGCAHDLARRILVPSAAVELAHESGVSARALAEKLIVPEAVVVERFLQEEQPPGSGVYDMPSVKRLHE